jgi:endonuclease/exonuclease/phosphatase family metal-dependent hydrolase
MGFHCVIMAAVALGVAGARADRLTVATYNVENYGLVDRMTPDGFRSAYPKPETEKAALRAVIRAIDADVLALQEIGSAEALEELRRDLACEGLRYPYSAYLDGPDRARHVALLSRRPWIRVTPHPDLDFAYLGRRERVKRGLLEAAVGTAAGELTVFVVHLKSHLTETEADPQAAERRAAEAAAVRGCIGRRFPPGSAARFVLLGDCNDGARSPTLRRLAASGGTLIALRLPARDSRDETWTELYRREESYATLDHILVSPALRAAVRGEARICDRPETGAASDHRPVLATLELPGGPGAAGLNRGGGAGPAQGPTVTGTVTWPPLP